MEQGMHAYEVILLKTPGANPTTSEFTTEAPALYYVG
jgi:hypothetical protein